MNDPAHLRPFRLGDLVVRPSRLVVERGDEVVDVEPKAMEVLVVLAERPGRSFPRRELLDRVWPDVVVGDETLTRAIYVLRKALGDASRDPSYIETIPKIGYRLLAPVERLSPEGLAPSEEEPTAGSSANRRVRGALAGLGALVVTGIVAWVFVLQGAAPGASRPEAFRVTSEPGVEWGAAAAPAGDRIAYSVGDGPNGADLWVRDLGGTRRLRLTADSLADHSPAWSPDGASIAFLRTGRDRCRILLVPALGGPEREIATCEAPAIHPAFHHLSWSRDGRWIAWSDGGPSVRRAEVRLIDMRAGAVRTLEIEDRSGRPIPALGPTFSPDGGAIAFHAISDSGTSLRIVPFRNGRIAGPPRTVAVNVNNVLGFAWGPDGDDIYLSSDRDGRPTLYRVAADGGEMIRMNVAPDVLRPIVVPSRGILVYEEWVYDFDLHALPLDAPGPGAFEPPIVDSTQWDAFPAISPDGRRLAFLSSRTGRTEVYLADPRGDGEETPLTVLSAQGLSAPRWSPEGSRLLFVAQIDRGGDGPVGGDIYVIDALGSAPRRLTNWPGHEISPSWSRDGKWIYFGSDRDGAWQIWRVPVGGGAPERVTSEGGYVGREAPGGRLVHTRQGEEGLFRRPLEGDGRTSIVTSDFPSREENWIVRGDAVYRLERSDEGIPRLVTTDLSSGETAVVRELPSDLARNASFDVAPDGSRIYVARMTTVDSDLQAIPLPASKSRVGEMVSRLR